VLCEKYVFGWGFAALGSLSLKSFYVREPKLLESAPLKLKGQIKFRVQIKHLALFFGI